MKNTTLPFFGRRWLAVTLLLTGCGLKAPLALPPHPPATPTPPVQPQPAEKPAAP